MKNKKVINFCSKKEINELGKNALQIERSSMKKNKEETVKEKRIAEMRVMESQWIKDCGFFIHYVMYSRPANIHTHGLVASNNHLDLQITVPLSQQIAKEVLHIAVDMIKKGLVIRDGDIVSDILEGYDVKAKQFTEMGRPVIRLLLPDKAGVFPDSEDCDEVARGQMMQSEDD